MAPKENETGDGDEAAIKDAVEDKFGIRTDDVTTFTDTPSDRVGHPEEENPRGAGQKSEVNISTEGTRPLSDCEVKIENKAKPACTPEAIVA